jgi:hypothetical protein
MLDPKQNTLHAALLGLYDHHLGQVSAGGGKWSLPDSGTSDEVAYQQLRKCGWAELTTQYRFKLTDVAIAECEAYNRSMEYKMGADKHNVKLIKPLTDPVDRVRKEMETVIDELLTLRAKNAELQAQLDDLLKH